MQATNSQLYTVEEFTEIIDGCNNVEAISYSPLTKEWRVEYKTDLKPDYMKSDLLLDYLLNESSD